MIFKTNKTFLEIAGILLLIGGVFYFGFRFYQINNQLASLQEQLTPLIEKTIEEPIVEPMVQATSTATSTVSEEPEPNPCESLNCDVKDGWVNSGSTFTCQNSSNQTCTCQAQDYFDYSCSTLKQECIYSTATTRTKKSNCIDPARPDLIFQSPGYSPASPVAEDQMYFWATLKNQGSATAASFLSYLKIDGQKIAEFSSVSLASKGSMVVAWDVSWLAVAGSHELEVCADGGLQVAESSDTNNCAKTIFTVGEESTAILPDLIIESIDVSPYPLTAGQSVSFSVIVKNKGKAPAKASLTVPRLDLGNDGSWDLETWGAMPTKPLAIGSNETVFWRNVWTSVSGRHKIEICADAVSELVFKITESNETNNCLSEVLIVP